MGNEMWAGKRLVNFLTLSLAVREADVKEGYGHRPSGLAALLHC